MMLGSQCSPCCDKCPADGKPRTDPKDEGTWVPSGSWRNGGVTWTFTENQGDEGGVTWFFYGSRATSKKGGSASASEQRDWGNLCNWYSNKTTSPEDWANLNLNKRATRIPPEDAVVHIYTPVSTAGTGPVTVKNAYFWSNSELAGSSELTATSSAFDSAGGSVFNDASANGALATVNGGATFNDFSSNISSATVNGGATFNDSSRNTSAATVNGGATFNDSGVNSVQAVVNGGATFNDSSSNANLATVNGGATFNGTSANTATVNDGAAFNDSSRNDSSALVNGGATFSGASLNGVFATVNGGAAFYGFSTNLQAATVNGGAVFFDNACSLRTEVIGGQRIFAAHPTDLPTCSGSAPTHANRGSATCGCG